MLEYQVCSLLAMETMGQVTMIGDDLLSEQLGSQLNA